jgi:hypothetical protein
MREERYAQTSGASTRPGPEWKQWRYGSSTMPSKASVERRNWVAFQGEQKHNRSLGQNGNPLLEQGNHPTTTSGYIGQAQAMLSQGAALSDGQTCR